MDRKVGFIGIGNVGYMLLNKFLEHKLLDAKNIYTSNRAKENVDKLLEEYPEINVCESNGEVAASCKTIFLCVEPLNLPNVLLEIKPFLHEDTYLMVSTTMVLNEDLCKIYNGRITVFMPTLISMVNMGVTLAYHNDNVIDENKFLFELLMGKISEVNILHEEDIRVAQNMTASFPGFFAAIMEEFVKSAIQHSKNISAKDLEHMLLVSLEGAARLLLEKNLSFKETISRVSTKGGITHAGVTVYKEKLPEVFDAGLDATISRYDVIGELAKKQIEELL